MDPHGQLVVDLDGDGINDILIASGGGRGNEKSDAFRRSRYNFLLWGEHATDTTTSQTITIFKGGRNVAEEANVHMRDVRGRINYIMDMNNDGKLDIFGLSDRRVSNVLAPGIMLVNQGDRTWKEDIMMQEYTRAMLLTDADGDGIAQELMLHRGFCYPQRDGPDVDNPDYGIFSDEVKKFCSTRPVGTTAIYKYDTASESMKEISPQYQDISADSDSQPTCCGHGSYSGTSDCHAVSIASGDFDGDTLADQVVLYQTKMSFYYSSSRTTGELPIGDKYITVEVEFPDYCLSGFSVRVVDLDNDGTDEILVMCKNPGVFLLYTQGESATEWTLDNQCNSKGSMGSLFDQGLATFTREKLVQDCEDYDFSYWAPMQTICNNYQKKNALPKTETVGLCLVDMNNDGFIDATVTYDFGYLRFLRNEPSITNSKNRFIAFKMKGDGKNVNIYGIGATVVLYMKHKGVVKTQFREVSSYQHTGDKYGCKDDRIIFGLGENWDPMRVEVKWPNGVDQTWWVNKWSFTPGEMEVRELEIMKMPTISPTSLPSFEPTIDRSTPSPSPSLSPSLKPVKKDIITPNPTANNESSGSSPQVDEDKKPPKQVLLRPSSSFRVGHGFLLYAIFSIHGIILYMI